MATKKYRKLVCTAANLRDRKMSNGRLLLSDSSAAVTIFCNSVILYLSEISVELLQNSKAFHGLLYRCDVIVAASM